MHYGFLMKQMMINYLILGLTAAALAAVPLAAEPVTYRIDPAHSSAQFSVRHMMVSNTRGEFTKMEGVIVYDAKNPVASRVEASVDASTVNTREPKRDADLKGADFFDVAKFPTLSFKSKQVFKDSASGQLKLKGDLTMRGITREVVFNVDGPTPEAKSPRGAIVIGASATAKINRKDFGLTYNTVLETGGVLIGDEVTITLDIEAKRE